MQRSATLACSDCDTLTAFTYNCVLVRPRLRFHSTSSKKSLESTRSPRREAIGAISAMPPPTDRDRAFRNTRQTDRSGGGARFVEEQPRQAECSGGLDAPHNSIRTIARPPEQNRARRENGSVCRRARTLEISGRARRGPPHISFVPCCRRPKAIIFFSLPL